VVCGCAPATVRRSWNRAVRVMSWGLGTVLDGQIHTHACKPAAGLCRRREQAVSLACIACICAVGACMAELSMTRTGRCGERTYIWIWSIHPPVPAGHSRIYPSCLHVLLSFSPCLRSLRPVMFDLAFEPRPPVDRSSSQTNYRSDLMWPVNLGAHLMTCQRYSLPPRDPSPEAWPIRI
jgi:hypothetical protein